MAFWDKWRKKKLLPAEKPWLELSPKESVADTPSEGDEAQGREKCSAEEDTEEAVAHGETAEGPTKPQITASDSRLLSALAGRRSPLEAEAAVDDFVALGWDQIADEVRAMALGQRMVIPSCFAAMISAYPREAADALWEQRTSMPWRLRVAFYDAAQCDKEQALEDVLAHWQELPGEALAPSFHLLATVKSEQAFAKLEACLDDSDWTIAVKAAVALEAAGAKEYLPQMKAAADRSSDLKKASLIEIIHRMES